MSPETCDACSVVWLLLLEGSLVVRVYQDSNDSPCVPSSSSNSEYEKTNINIDKEEEDVHRRSTRRLTTTTVLNDKKKKKNRKKIKPSHPTSLLCYYTTVSCKLCQLLLAETRERGENKTPKFPKRRKNQPIHKKKKQGKKGKEDEMRREGGHPVCLLPPPPPPPRSIETPLY